MYIVHEIVSKDNTTVMLGNTTIRSSLESEDPLGGNYFLALVFAARYFYPATVQFKSVDFLFSCFDPQGTAFTSHCFTKVQDIRIGILLGGVDANGN